MSRICDTTAVILAGGLGTRLRSVVSDRPKVLAKVCGRPFLAYLLDQLERAGIKKVVLCCGYMAEKVRETFGPSYEGMEICYSVEARPLGTGGAVRFSQPHLSSDTILVLNGDSYIDADIAKYVNWYFEKQRQAGLLLTGVEDTSRYGKVCMDEDERITAFNEKGADSGPGLINAGVYLFAKSIIELLPTNETVSLEKELFPFIDTSDIYGFCCDGKFIDIGTPQSYASAESFFCGQDSKK
ncbi:MAG: nucleotidyltransferase family protein [Phycisphaerae bacterium]|nr:nucleotidyltransferase family protein [Phycisphaerae bacterium]